MKKLSSKKIIDAVVNFYNIPIESVFGKRRKKELVIPRHVIAYFLREKLHMSYPKIGMKLGARDHTTAIHAWGRVKNNIEKNPKFREEIEQIQNIIFGNDLSTLFKIEKENNKNVVIKEKESSYPIPVEIWWERILKSVKKSSSNIIIEREKSMLEEWHAGQTLEAIGKEWKLTRERVRQIITRAIFRELSKKMEEGFEIDIEEFLLQEKNKHKNIRDFKNNKRSKEVEKNKKPWVWSRFHSACRKCGTIKIPHHRNGLCKKCCGIRINREEIIRKKGGICESCGINRTLCFQKFGRDFYITDSINKERTDLVLCRSCFLKLMGRKLAASRGRL